MSEMQKTTLGTSVPPDSRMPNPECRIPTSWSLHEGNAIDLMRSLPDGSIDAIVSDPPFGTTNARWDQVATNAEWWREALRVTRQDSAIVLFACGQYMADLIVQQRELYRYKWVWKRGERPTGAIDVSWRPLRIHEDVLVFCRKRPAYYPVMRKGSLVLKRPLGSSELYGDCRHDRDQTYYSAARHPQDVIDVASPRGEARVHPTQKPVELLDLLVRSYVPEGGVVLDPFAGSGATGVAAVMYRRRAILCERDAEYAKVIRDRMSRAAPVERDPNAPLPPSAILGGELFP